MDQIRQIEKIPTRGGPITKTTERKNYCKLNPVQLQYNIKNYKKLIMKKKPYYYCYLLAY